MRTVRRHRAVLAALGVVDVLDVPSAAVAGAATLTQTSCVAPAARLAVAVIEVVQVESKKLVAKVPPDDVRL